MARFGEVLTAMVTPFTANGDLDLDGAVKLAKWLVEQGNDGLVIAGTTGEASTITDDEQFELVEAVAGAVTVPVVAGAGANDTRHAIYLTSGMKARGAAAVLSVTPYYNRPSQAGIEAHFRAVAAATDLPVILYDIPVRTGRRIAPEVLLSLAREVPNIVALKDAAGDYPGTARLMSQAPAGFELYSGDDSMTLAFLTLGGQGVIGVATHWCAAEHKEMITAFKKGDVERAQQIQSRLIESFDFETGDANPNPIPSKAMLRTLGLPAGECRLPMGPTPAGLEDRARAVMANLLAHRR
jgi:4-hydroxy-tetrahydrodipicolinate synthase